MIYILIVLIFTVIYGPHLWAKRILNKYNNAEYFSGNGIELARIMLNQLNMTDILVEGGTLAGDHYDPVNKTIRLSDERCGRKTLTAVVVAAHEVGHAIQDKDNYKPLQVRTRMIGTAAKMERVGAAIVLVVPVFTVIQKQRRQALH